MPWQLACRATGLSTQTLEAWCSDDPTLWEEIDQAQAEATLELANDFNRLARKDPKVLLELLKHRCPEAYGARSRPVPRPEPGPPTGAEILRQLAERQRAEALEENPPVPEVTVHPQGHAPAARPPVQPAIAAPRPSPPAPETGSKRYTF